MKVIDTLKQYWKSLLGYFAATVIPIIMWVSGLIPTFVVAEDLEHLNLVYQKSITDLTVKQTDLAIDFKSSEREDIEKERLHVEREIFLLKRQGETIPPFYNEQRLRYKQNIDRLNEDIEDLRSYRFKIHIEQHEEDTRSR